MFISITFTETSIDKTNKAQEKVRRSKFMFKMSTIHANIQTTTPLLNCCRDGVVQQPPLAQQMFFQLLHIMVLRTVDPLLKDTSDAVVNRIQIWRIGWPHLWRDKLWRLSLQHDDGAWWTAWFQWCQYYVTHQVRDVHGTQHSKFTRIINIHLQSCVPTIIEIRAYL